MIEQLLVAEAKEFSASPRWEAPDSPGSARVMELHHRLSSPESFTAFRATPDGQFVLAVIEAYECALNDEWLPMEILGLALEDARLFIGLVASEIETNGLSVAVTNLRQSYISLTKR